MQTIIIENGKDKVDVFYQQDIDSLKKEFSLRSKSIFVTDHKVFQNKQLKDAILNTTSPYVFANESDQNSFERLSKKTKSTRLGGDCYSYCLLADGHVDIVIESGLAPWDIRALEPIILNAGGILKTWDNNEIFSGGKIIACTNKSLFNNARNILNKKKPS